MSTDKSNEHWDFYSCQIDDKPHSTMVNLALVDIAPITNLSVFYCVEVKLRHPSPKHGMTTNEEFQPLSDLEDLISGNQTEKLKYIARQTGDSKRKFYFYGSAQADFDSLIDRIDQAFPTYEKTTFDFEDPQWEAYLDDLYPNAMAMNEITNRAVLVHMEDAGDDLNLPRTIDHSIIFDNRKSVKEFEKIVKEKGFTVEINSSGFLKKTYDLLVQRVDRPADLDPVTFELEQLAQSLGGSYDGWGCLQQGSVDEGQ